MKRITKYALLITRNNKILLQEEKGQGKLLLPGGKPRKNEDYLKCLRREIKEELKAEIKEGSLKPLGKFEDIAADGKAILTAELYLGELKTRPKPGKEVKRLVWFSPKGNANRLSPVIRNKIIPYLHAVRLLN